MSNMKEMQLSRRGLVASALGACAMAAIPASAFADQAKSKISTGNGYLADQIDMTSMETYAKGVDELGIGWVRYALGDNSMTCEVVGVYPTLAEGEAALVEEEAEERGIIWKIFEILVKVGKQVIGYIKAKVDIGSWIIGEVLSASAHYIVQRVASSLPGKRYSSTYVMPCSVYPPHSYEYIRCTNA